MCWCVRLCLDVSQRVRQMSDTMRDRLLKQFNPDTHTHTHIDRHCDVAGCYRRLMMKRGKKKGRTVEG